MKAARFINAIVPLCAVWQQTVALVMPSAFSRRSPSHMTARPTPPPLMAGTRADWLELAAAQRRVSPRQGERRKAPIWPDHDNIAGRVIAGGRFA